MANKYGKQDFIDKYAEITGRTKKDAREIIEGVADTFRALTMNVGDKVTIPGFIMVERVLSPERVCRNPQDGTSMVIPPRERMKAKVSKKFNNK